MLPAGWTDEYGNPLIHEQTMTSKGFRVDTGLKELLELLWAAGLTTEYSCERNDQSQAYIAFPTGNEHWMQFVLGTVGPTQANVAVSHTAGVSLVSWDHRFTPIITSVWREKCA